MSASLTPRCNHEGCQADAKWAAKICVPAQGWPIDQHKPLEMILGVGVCETHWPPLDLQPSLSADFQSEDPGAPSLRRVFEFMAAGRCAPDFDRAWLAKVSVNSREFMLATSGRRSS